jgi:hypothetical protein
MQKVGPPRCSMLRKTEHEQVVRLLLEKGADINAS